MGEDQTSAKSDVGDEEEEEEDDDDVELLPPMMKIESPNVTVNLP